MKSRHPVPQKNKKRYPITRKSEMEIYSVFSKAAATKKLHKSWSAYFKKYALKQQVAENRLSLIKNGSKLPPCPCCSENRDIGKIKRKKTEQIRYRCKDCKKRTEYSLLTKTRLKNHDWRSNELLLVCFYLANASKPQPYKLAHKVKNPRSIKKIISIWQKNRKSAITNRYVRSKDTHIAKAFKYAAIILQPHD